ncbi:MAG: Uma2 family endonuclease [Chloroherpetonaceae bacterium]|nr:Uma2 family endonuclease [Chloroherpetonaceae bacterium]
MQDTVEILSQYELERGKPMPSKNHSLVQSNLLYALSDYRTKFSILPELSLEFSGQVYVPDLCICEKMKIDWLNDETKLTTAPLTVIEIASPSQGYEVFEEKLKGYFLNGVKSFWLVNPFLQSIALFTPNEQKPQVISTGLLTDEVTGIKIPIEKVFE